MTGRLTSGNESLCIAVAVGLAKLTASWAKPASKVMSCRSMLCHGFTLKYMWIVSLVIWQVPTLALTGKNCKIQCNSIIFMHRHGAEFDFEVDSFLSFFFLVLFLLDYHRFLRGHQWWIYGYFLHYLWFRGQCECIAMSLYHILLRIMLFHRCMYLSNWWDL